jgi:hypothetical protein
MTQPEALRLADLLEMGSIWQDQEKAATELRRLHAENEALREANEAFGKRQEWWNERMFALEQQRDALTEACKAVIAAGQSEGAGRGGFVNTPPTREHQRRVAQAWQELHAAIKNAEGEEA